jgi:hypothetical protein
MNNLIRFAFLVVAVMLGFAGGKQIAALLNSAGVSIAVSGE